MWRAREMEGWGGYDEWLRNEDVDRDGCFGD